MLTERSDIFETSQTSMGGQFSQKSFSVHKRAMTKQERVD